MLTLIDKKIFTILPQLFKKILDLQVCSKKNFSLGILTKKSLMVRETWVKVQNFQDPELKKLKFLNMMPTKTNNFMFNWLTVWII